ncbi:GAF domain-containing protein [Merismopedia glauca]|uniref:Chemotaxis protein n=1 Tax=Merismopedia glauca CCAP 1448/3 TaxID=1296344 RepID=A0A2T1C219_9CYAN|nr:GAF domain-containing protein [Merismopedia glauca]PSB02197.1 chemotaxis protein [Merismopedia glauca CCAP 1448/3]
MNQPPNEQPESAPKHDSRPKLNRHNSESSENMAKIPLDEVGEKGNLTQTEDGVDRHQSSIASLDHSRSLIMTEPSKRSLVRQPKLSPQIIAIAIALTTLPPLAIATATYFSHKSLEQKVAQTPINSSITTQKLEQETNYLLWMSCLTAIVAGGLSVWAVRKTVAPILDAAAISTMLVRRLRIQEMSSTPPAAGKDALRNLARNMDILQQRFPDLLLKQELTSEMLQLLAQITTGLRNAASEEEVLRITTNQVRQAFRTDRVTIFRYDRYPQGTFVAEAIGSGFPRLVWSTIESYPISDRYLNPSSNPPVIAIDNILQADLSDEELELYQRFGVKAFLTTPIYRHGKIFGLLIAHQCNTERLWQPLELDLLTQIANQVGLALESAQNMEQVEGKINQARIFIRTTQLIRSSLDEDEVLKTSVEAIRREIDSERVIIYKFDEQWYGTVLAESIAPGYPKMLWAEIYDPCFEEGFIEKYQAGRVQATNNIYEAGLTECYIDQMETFKVKANLVAPILKDNYLFGLLIAHQCSDYREWQQWEIDWFAQIASEVGYALDHARLLKQIEAESQRSHLFTQLIRRIRSSIKFDEIVKTSVEEARKAIAADRVIILILQPDGTGDVAAESISPGLPHAIAYKFKPSWIPEPLRQAYRQGQVIATDDVFASQFNGEQIQLLQRLGIQSSLVAPILVKNEQLFGLLMAHQCTQSRQWQTQEIEMFAQIATQIGYALEPAQIVDQVEQAYQSAAIATLEQRRQLEKIEQQLTHLLVHSQTIAGELQQEQPRAMESVTETYNQIQSLANLTQKIVTAAEQTKIREQHISEMLQGQFKTLHALQAKNSALQDTGSQAAQTFQQIQLPIDRLIEAIELISKIANQLKLQSVNVALEASRYGGEGQKLREIAEKVMAYLRQLELDLGEVKPLVASIQTQSQTAALALNTSAETSSIGNQLLTSTQQELNQILAVTGEIGLLADGIVQSATEQSSNLQSASEKAIALAQIISNKAQSSEVVSQFMEELTALTAVLKTIKL